MDAFQMALDHCRVCGAVLQHGGASVGNAEFNEERCGVSGVRGNAGKQQREGRKFEYPSASVGARTWMV